MNVETGRALLERLKLGLPALVDQAPRVLADPRSHPREAMLFALIAVLAVLLLVFLVFAIMDTALEFRRKRAVAIGLSRRGMWARTIIRMSAMLVLLAVLALAPMVPVTGSACGGCHSVTEAVTSWGDGTHHAVSCYGCHTSGTPGGAIGASVGGVVRRVWGASSLNGPGISSAACLRCHDEVAVKIIVADVRMRHEDVIAQGMSCLECHAWVGHEGMASGVDSERSVMSLCLTCHDGEAASSACDVCHLERPLDVASGTDPVAFTPIEPTCRGCHSEALSRRCTECHGLEMPHPASFMSQHAGDSQSDPSVCARCHEQASAAEGCACHTDVNVHGTFSDWFPRHGARALAGGQPGCNCHKLVFCARCHQSDPYR